MPSLAYFLNRTQELCSSIQELEFKAPGIFTNSIIAEPSITTLLKDAEDHELALYRIRKPVINRTRPISTLQTGSGQKNANHHTAVQESGLNYKPERVDGKTYYIDQSFHEFMDAEEEGRAGSEVEQSRKRTAVWVPEIVPNKRATNASVSPPSSPNKLFAQINIEEGEIEQITSEALDIIRKYPSLVSEEEEANLLAYQKKFISLKKEVQDLKDIEEKQARQLAEYNFALSDALLLSSPLRGVLRVEEQAENEDSEEELHQVDIDTLLEQEELAIGELEDKLELISQQLE